MSRPATVQDLPADKFAGDAVVEITMTALPASGQLTYALGQFQIAAEKAGLLATQQYGRVTYSVRATEKELAERLERMQSRWDSARMQYDLVLVSGEEPGQGEYEVRSNLTWFCQLEKLPKPWTQEARDLGELKF